VRQLVSKLIAGGLSAGVILLWWPMFFPTDSVTTWLCRGIAWTLCFELLLLALSPFELALWSTHRGERLSSRARAAGGALLHHPSQRRRLGHAAAVGGAALAVPLTLIALGVSSDIPAHAASAPKVTQVTRVVRVVKPVRVERVVKVRTVSHSLPPEVIYSAPTTLNHPRPRHVTRSPRTIKKPAPKTMPKSDVRTPRVQTAPPTDAGAQPTTPVPSTPDQSGSPTPSSPPAR
jgi:hypothetical protein